MALRVGVIFGGRSGEHEVSLASAASVMRALAEAGHQVVPVGIARDGRWLTGGDPLGVLAAEARVALPAADATGSVKKALVERAGSAPVAGAPLARLEAAGGLPAGLRRELDVVFIMLHGPYGEDGTIQGVLELSDLPYVGAGVTASPAGMDEAARHDRKLLVERAVAGREIEVSVLGNDEPRASLPGEILYAGEWYDYETKYAEGQATVQVPAPLAPGLECRFQELALAAFRAIDAAGMARVDFFLEGDRILVNEINTIPGFTSTSVYARLWEASGLSYAELVSRLLDLALERHRDRPGSA